MNYVDLRDIIEQKEDQPEQYNEWKKAIENAGYNFEELAENEPTIIPRTEWRDYCEELASEIGAISDKLQWPLTHIDWDAAADELEIDYASVEVQGIEYLFRSY